MKIEIKERKLTEGKRALYLEYYESGYRKRENLHLYLLPDDAVGAAKHNRLTYNKAMEIRAERILTPPVLEKENAKSEEQGNGLTWLQWCDDYIKWSVDCGNCKKMIGHKNVVRKRIVRNVDITFAQKFECRTGNGFGIYAHYARLCKKHGDSFTYHYVGGAESV